MLNRFISLFFLAPIFRGFIAMLISGTCFPLCGVMLLRLNLVPLRYMLMHGVILGGAIALAMNLPVVSVVVIINIILVLSMFFFTKNSSFGFSSGSAASMVLSMAIASMIIHIKDVPAKDTLNILWGSPFALKNTDIFVIIALSIILVLYVVFNYRNILALFFNQEIAKSMGLNVRFHYVFMVMIIALIVAVSMQLLGAFLIDSLLIIPVLCSSFFVSLLKESVGIKKLLIFSCVFGFAFSLVGYFLAVLFNLLPAATISIVSGVTYIFLIFVTKYKELRIYK